MTLDELRAQATGLRDGYPCWESELGRMAVTLPEAEFLHALVALTRPNAILELGTGSGITGRFIAEAAATYGGWLTTVERDPVFVDRARDLLHDPLPVSVVETEPEGASYDLVFIDSAVNHRSADIVRWLGYKLPDPLVVVHDTDRRYPELRLGEGMFVDGPTGFWIGRAA